MLIIIGSMKKKISQFSKQMSGNAGELFVVAELLRRGIIASLLPAGTKDNDIIITRRDTENKVGFIQVKTSDPNHNSGSFPFNNLKRFKEYQNAPDNQYVVFVRLESKKKIPLEFWITTKKEIGEEVVKWGEETKTVSDYKDIRIGIPGKRQKMGVNVKEGWEDNWDLFKEYESV